MNLEQKCLDELGTISRGKSKHRPRNDPSLFDGKYPFIQTADVKNANFYITEYSQTYNEKGLAQSKLWKKGTLCITIAANIADTGILGIDACFPDSIMGFVPYEDKSDVRYVKYCFDILQKQCQQISQGATQDNLSWEKLSTIKFPVPPIDAQKQIADILSAYDDLIENNQKQIKLLEEAAQRLYKEWFVDLRFPGHENTPITDGIPQGWKEGTIQDIVVYHDKKRKPLSGMQRAEMQGKYRYYGAASILDYVNNYLFDGTYLLLGEDGTVITQDGYPILQYVTGKFWANNHAHVLTGKPDYPTEYLYMMFKATKVKDIVTGVAQPKISQARLSNKKTIIPNKEIVRDFCSIVSPMFKQILSLEDQIELSKEARDRLLPKLMSGELEV
ncbi:MAG: restriction endonuclease subunit S [Clostridia bacterium]|nr:restriction endonuclease subunit S [Clostridia bacterium]